MRVADGEGWWEALPGLKCFGEVSPKQCRTHQGLVGCEGAGGSGVTGGVLQARGCVL